MAFLDNLLGKKQRTKRLTAELIEIGRREGYISNPGEKYDEHHNHKRAREIGAILDDTGGMELMREVHSKIASEFRGSARARELESCWGGVGHWRR